MPDLKINPEPAAEKLFPAVEDSPEGMKNDEVAFEKKYAAEKVAESDQSYKAVLSQIQATKGDDLGDVEVDAKMISAKLGAEIQVQDLVQLAFDKGVVHAVKVAKHLDYYSIDKLHDILLSEELHRALVAKGMLTEE